MPSIVEFELYMYYRSNKVDAGIAGFPVLLLGNVIKSPCALCKFHKNINAQSASLRSLIPAEKTAAEMNAPMRFCVFCARFECVCHCKLK